ncbi:hypothetical protein [Rudanella lutea]|uniref:hypothetical protein n=1 Tax=Rudanella lutea TaxID=451374 RepID=UPI00037AC504|nr:hypothetical protein [Rudanella lutea]
MILTQDQQKKLSNRITALSDFGGLQKVAEVAGCSKRTIQKAMWGGNVKLETAEAIEKALKEVESEYTKRKRQLEKALA